MWAQKCTSARFAEGETVMKKYELIKEYDDGDMKLKQINYVPDKHLLNDASHCPSIHLA